MNGIFFKLLAIFGEIFDKNGIQNNHNEHEKVNRMTTENISPGKNTRKQRLNNLWFQRLILEIILRVCF